MAIFFGTHLNRWLPGSRFWVRETQKFDVFLNPEPRTRKGGLPTKTATPPHPLWDATVDSSRILKTIPWRVQCPGLGFGVTLDAQISHLLLDEYFSVGDERFLAALRSFSIPGRLATLADRWKKDSRPWAREQIFKYLDEPLNAPAHETVVKRLFKHAEQTGDDELVAAFAVAFDRLVRRRLAKRWRYDHRTPPKLV